MNVAASHPPALQTVLALELVSPQLECRPDEKRTRLLVIDQGIRLSLNFAEGEVRESSLRRFTTRLMKASPARSRKASQLPLWEGRPLVSRRRLHLDIEIEVRPDIEVRREDDALLLRTGDVQVQLRFTSDQEVHRFVSVLDSWYLGQSPAASAGPSA